MNLFRISKIFPLFIVALLFLGQRVLFSFGLMLAPSPNQPFYECNVLLTKVAMQPNEWDFTCTWCPWMTEDGLSEGVTFEVQSPNFHTMNIPEAEKIYAKMCKLYLKGINEIKIIRPYLQKFPVDISQLFLCVSFREEGWKALRPPLISAIMYDCMGWMEYHQSKSKSGDCHPTVLRKWPRNISAFKDLFFISVPRTHDPVKPKIPQKDLKKGKNSPYCKLVFKIGSAFSEKNHLHYLLDGFVGEDGREGNSFGYLFCGDQKLSLEEARKLASSGAKEFLAEFQKSKEISRILEDRNRLRFEHNGPVAEPRHVTFRISFWDEDINRVEEPYIAEIRVGNGLLKYFTADEGQRLKLVHQDTFDEAVR